MKLLVEIFLKDPERVWRVYQRNDSTMTCQEILLIRNKEYVYQKDTKNIIEVKMFFEALDIREMGRVIL